MNLRKDFKEMAGTWPGVAELIRRAQRLGFRFRRRVSTEVTDKGQMVLLYDVRYGTAVMTYAMLIYRDFPPGAIVVAGQYEVYRYTKAAPTVARQDWDRMIWADPKEDKLLLAEYFLGR